MTNSPEELTDKQKMELRQDIVFYSGKLLGIKYEYGYEWKDFSVIPDRLDCSELVEGCYNHYGLKMPDGSQNQFNFTIPTLTPLFGDLVFFGRGTSINQIYHVGIVYDGLNIIEARAFDKDANFKTGEVILRPMEKWEMYKNFVGYRAHPKLAAHA